MKNLKYILSEGILGDIEDRINTNDAEAIIRYEVLKFLESNYINHRKAMFRISDKPNKDGMFEVSINGSVTAKGKLQSITNGKFVFKEVKGWFDVTLCHDLISLEGCPKYVGDNFKCTCCENLKSLEGCPEHVGSFKMGLCDKIETLKYAPKTVDHDFLCYKCKSLKSLKGCTNFIPGRFDCSRCESLHSIEYCPEYVGENFECYSCGTKFYKSDIEKYCKVIGSIKY